MRIHKTATPLLLALLVTSAIAIVANGQGRLHDRPSGPYALTGDTLPPFGMIAEDGRFTPSPYEMPAGLHPGPAGVPESDAAGPSLKLAMRAAQAAIDACQAAGFPIGAAVIDSAGQPRALLNADTTDGSHGFVAMRKAAVALAFGQPSSQVEQALRTDARLQARVTRAMFVAGGAVPIVARGKTIGAIGASGAAGRIIGEQDERCARAGRDAIVREFG